MRSLLDAKRLAPSLPSGTLDFTSCTRGRARCRGTGWRISSADRPPRPPQETSRRLNHESAPRRVWPLLLTKEDLGLPGIVRDGERLVGTRARQLVPLVRGIEEVRDRAAVDPLGADG